MLCVIEGLDGSGKSTQCELLVEKLTKQGIKVNFLHFPRYQDSIFGELIASFLRGELGQLNDNSPYLIALLFTVDQWQSQDLLKEEENSLILLDRYFYSNLAYQSAKIKNETEQNKFINWLVMANKKLALREADLAIYLDVPKQFREQNLLSKREGESRNYLQTKNDIHEVDLSFQESVHQQYIKLTTILPQFERLDCTNNNLIDTIENVNIKIINKLKEKGLKIN